ncbi:phosphoribosyltransferase [Jatrophihabitans telluris]|uniref:Phosphoribosyltransferase n=1 Tax=Jatrophihabitans telluris TaxID=2038343 RepID=A0ABY4R353_9ACTN|nr:phosphoribosyltransferase [Jatrophihabitans telluris]UQX90263.1 phosphoribosyltransferase [Jatrophihabitans telluris]
MREHLGIELTDTPGRTGLTVTELAGIALRRNRKRAQLLVSSVLGKHCPTDPRIVYGAGLLLGELVTGCLATGEEATRATSTMRGEQHGQRQREGGELLRRGLAGDAQAAQQLLDRCSPASVGGSHPGVLVLGYAETATGLGHAVADALGCTYLHSTRRHVPGSPPTGGFSEEHSHATEHLLVPEDVRMVEAAATIVLVDDELSTGRTVRNTIAALQATAPRARYVIASLIDLRPPAEQEELQRFAREQNTQIQAVALAGGRIELPGGLDESAATVISALDDRTTPVPDPGAPAGSSSTPSVAGTLDRVLSEAWPAGVREGGRHGFDPGDRPALLAAAERCARALVGDGPADRVLVLGTEELMYAPMQIALALQRICPQSTVRYSTTTRSPVLAVDDARYPIRTAISFPAFDRPVEGPAARFAYNVAAGQDRADRFDRVILVTDDETDSVLLAAPGGLLDQLRHCVGRVSPVRIPAHRPRRSPLRGPRFGSYPAEEVAWLLQDLSAVDLEAPTEEREEAIQGGGAHYAESLPIEYQPSPEYQRLYEQAVSASSLRVAHAVGIVTERVLAARGPHAVLVSLARAGTPVGVLMRRWARWRHGLELDHYAVSIVRGRGIDASALAFLARHHDPRSVMFVDGWTGKGAIARELAAAVARANDPSGPVGLGDSPAVRFEGFSGELAVLADTGSCVRIFGTRDDFLIPSACLNSTVSGLVSRTVLNDELIGSGELHGAKFYRELAPVDVSGHFVDAVSARFAEVGAGVDREVCDQLAGRVDTEPTWAGWRAVEALSEEYGIHQVNLVKPGVGETTRVLLRRVPWRILVRPSALTELAHVLLLAEQRGVPIEERADLPYSCVGLIHPRYTRSAVGADGVSAGAPA